MSFYYEQLIFIKYSNLTLSNVCSIIWLRRENVDVFLWDLWNWEGDICIFFPFGV
nr:MAG TPA: hypothetical protein [Caudoviricetes sp.]